jgi:hypothetical protein
MDNREQRFEDGNVSDVVRVGDTVRRTAGPWTLAVHALLQHLEARGFDGAPRARGLDHSGREVLTYVDGRTGPASLDGIGSDEVLVAVAQLVRRYHDAVADFKRTVFVTISGIFDTTDRRSKRPDPGRTGRFAGGRRWPLPV